MGYSVVRVRGHVEVFLNGDFQFSADTIEEAVSGLERLEYTPSSFDG